MTCSTQHQYQNQHQYQAKVSNNQSKMTPVLKKYKAAAVNAEPGWFNLEESVRRTIHWIDEAGKAGCKMIAFPELCTLPSASLH